MIVVDICIYQSNIPSAYARENKDAGRHIRALRKVIQSRSRDVSIFTQKKRCCVNRIGHQRYN